MYDAAKYIKNPITGENCGIFVLINGKECVVPLDPANTDYSNIMRLVSEGYLMIAPADA